MDFLRSHGPLQGQSQRAISVFLYCILYYVNPLSKGAAEPLLRTRQESLPGVVPLDPAVFHLDQPVGHRVVLVIVADDEDRLAEGLELRQNLEVEDRLELRVLVSGPFVEEIDRAPLQVGGEECEPLALTLGELEGREDAVLDLDLVVQLEPDDVVPGRLV